MSHEFINGQTTVEQVISHKLINCIFRILQVVSSLISEDGSTLLNDDSFDGIPVGDGSIFCHIRKFNAPIVIEHFVWFNESSEGNVTSSLIVKVVVRRAFINFRTGISRMLFFIGDFIRAMKCEFVVETGFTEQLAKNMHVVSTGNKFRNRLSGRKNHLAHYVQHTIRALIVSFNHARAACGITVDEIVMTLCILHTFQTTVVEIGKSESLIGSREFDTFISTGVTIVNDTVQNDELFLLVRKRFYVTSFVTGEFNDTLLHCLIVGCKDSVVTASGEHTGHRGGIGLVAKFNLIQELSDGREFI